MRLTIRLWLIAFIVTVAAAYYQRVTGPTYALSGKTEISGKEILYKLSRSHGGETNAPIEIVTNDSTISGFVEWKRSGTQDPWTKAFMTYRDGKLHAELPHQPPAGKLQYRIVLTHSNSAAIIPADDSVTIRFKGDVPLYVLIPHIIAMFCSLLFAARAGLEYFNPESNLLKLTYWTIASLFVGGIILGPIVQHYAFNAWWTGWPLGRDLTDNKTAMVLLAWIGVTVALRKSKNPQTWALAAAILMFLVYLIPHSLLGSEIDYRALDQQKVKLDTTTHR